MQHNIARIAAILFMAVAGPVAAQVEPLEKQGTIVTGPDLESYPRAFFDRFQPQTALELLQRVPGFSIQGGESLRGFAGGAGNVLIDGERPTIKAGGLEDFLLRIPADAVERIEISRGAQRAGETAGQALVANVVRKANSIAGTWSAELEANAEGLVYPRGELSLTAPLGEWQTTTKLNAFWEQFVFTDFNRLQLDADGELVLFEDEELPSTLRDAFIASEAKRSFGGGTLTLNGRFGNSRFYQESERDGYIGREPDGRPDRRTDIRFDSEFWEGELSADWTRAVGNNSLLKLLALGSYRDIEQSAVTVNEEPVGQLGTATRFKADRKPFEILSRVTLGRLEGKFRPEYGIEAAYNRLASTIAFETETDGVITPVTLPASDVVVEEIRGEAFVNTVWQAAPKWTVEGGMAVELSRIAVDNNTGGETDFIFLKPSLALSYQPTDNLQLRTSLRRSVGQLDFNDFASSASAEDDRVVAGNPDLGPDQTWHAGASVDYRTDGGFALNIEPFHEWREDVLEQIVLPSGVTGLANAGNARLWGVDIEGALPLSGLIPGGLLEVSADFRDASFDDPITGETRNVNGLRSPIIEIDFRQDLTDHKLAWGAGYEAPYDIAFFFADEIDAGSPTSGWSAFVETTRFFGVKAQLEVRNIGGRDFPRERRFFAPDRSGVFTGSEIQERRRGEFVKLTISDQF